MNITLTALHGVSENVYIAYMSIENKITILRNHSFQKISTHKRNTSHTEPATNESSLPVGLFCNRYFMLEVFVTLSHFLNFSLSLLPSQCPHDLTLKETMLLSTLIWAGGRSSKLPPSLTLIPFRLSS